MLEGISHENIELASIIKTDANIAVDVLKFFSPVQW